MAFLDRRGRVAEAERANSRRDYFCSDVRLVIIKSFFLFHESITAKAKGAYIRCRILK
jgi:hypothetical protein